MARRDVATIALLGALVASCAHHHRASPGVIRAAKEHEAWLAKLPPCAPDALATAIGVAELAAPHDDSKLAVRGMLALTEGAACTKMDCGDDEDVCCNGCDVAWVVVASRPSANQQKAEVGIRMAGDEHPMVWGARDCDLRDLHERVPGTDVIVTGRFLANEWRLVDSTVCLVATTK